MNLGNLYRTCESLVAYSRQCGKNAKAGLNADVYLIAFDDLAPLVGGTDVFTESATGLITAINIAAPTVAVFVKYGAVIGQNSLKEDFTANANGSYDVVKELAFSIADMGNVDGKSAVEALFGEPVAYMVRLQTGKWVVGGLNGQTQLKTSSGTIDASSNTRVVTLSGSDGELLQPVDPTIVPTLIVKTVAV